MAFIPREIIPGLPQEAQRELFQIQQELARALEQVSAPRVTELKDSDHFASAFEFVRVEVPATGLSVVLPEPRGVPKGAWIVVLTESTAGTLTLEAVGGAVNGAATLTSTVVGALTLYSNGADGWFV